MPLSIYTSARIIFLNVIVCSFSSHSSPYNAANISRPIAIKAQIKLYHKYSKFKLKINSRFRNLRLTVERTCPLGLDRFLPDNMDRLRYPITPRCPGLRRVERGGTTFRCRIRLPDGRFLAAAQILRTTARLHLLLGLRIRAEAGRGGRGHTHLRRVLRATVSAVRRRAYSSALGSRE